MTSSSIGGTEHEIRRFPGQTAVITPQQPVTAPEPTTNIPLNPQLPDPQAPSSKEPAEKKNNSDADIARIHKLLVSGFQPVFEKYLAPYREADYHDMTLEQMELFTQKRMDYLKAVHVTFMSLWEKNQGLYDQDVFDNEYEKVLEEFDRQLFRPSQKRELNNKE